MKKISALILAIMTSCLVDHTDEYLKNVAFDKTSSTLHVNYSGNPDTSLQQIIILSNIRKEGYGVLLNIDQEVNKTKLDSIIYKFMKQDINAVHPFHWRTANNLPSKERVAIEGARFTWLFTSDSVNLNDTIFQPLNSAIEISKNKGGILVKGSNATRNYPN